MAIVPWYYRCTAAIVIEGLLTRVIAVGWGCYDNSRGQVISLDWLKVNTWSEKEITIIITYIYMICRELIVHRRVKIRATAFSPTSNLTLGKWSLPPWRPLDGWRVSHWGIIALWDLEPCGLGKSASSCICLPLPWKECLQFLIYAEPQIENKANYWNYDDAVSFLVLITMAEVRAFMSNFNTIERTVSHVRPSNRRSDSLHR